MLYGCFSYMKIIFTFLCICFGITFVLESLTQHFVSIAVMSDDKIVFLGGGTGEVIHNPIKTKIFKMFVCVCVYITI